MEIDTSLHSSAKTTHPTPANENTQMGEEGEVQATPTLDSDEKIPMDETMTPEDARERFYERWKLSSDNESSSSAHQRVDASLFEPVQIAGDEEPLFIPVAALHPQVELGSLFSLETYEFADDTWLFAHLCRWRSLSAEERASLTKLLPQSNRDDGDDGDIETLLSLVFASSPGIQSTRNFHASLTSDVANHGRDPLTSFLQLLRSGLLHRDVVRTQAALDSLRRKQLMFARQQHQSSLLASIIQQKESVGLPIEPVPSLVQSRHSHCLSHSKDTQQTQRRRPKQQPIS